MVLHNLAINGNLDTLVQIYTRDDTLGLLTNAALVGITIIGAVPARLGLTPNLIKGIGVMRVMSGDVVCAPHAIGAWVSGVMGQRGEAVDVGVGVPTARSAGGRGEGKGASVVEFGADREDDAEGHGGGEDGGHGCDDGLDGVVDAGGGHDEPEDHVDHVDDPDGAVEVEAVAEHELPGGQGARLEGVDGAVQGEGEGDGVQEGGGDPVDSDPSVLGTCDAALAFEKGYSCKDSVS